MSASAIQRGNRMIRLGLCCLFKEEPIHFRHITAKNLKRIDPKYRLKKLSDLCLVNSRSLLAAIETVNRLEIKSFRVMTPLFPLYTHPEEGYIIDSLPECGEIKQVLERVKRFKNEFDIRLSLHPDQFNVLNSPRKEVVDQTVRELEYQNILAEHIGADVINIHLGGVYGDKDSACKRFIENLKYLSEVLRSKLTIENDDRSYTPSDLFPVSKKTGIPVVYDVHHHRCNKDDLSEKEATDLTVNTWKEVGREPYFHISSPKGGWQAKNIKAHSDFIDIEDFPEYWKQLKSDLTVDIEAKAKELAVKKLRNQLSDVIS